MIHSGNLQQSGVPGSHIDSPQSNVLQCGFQGSCFESPQGAMSQILQGGGFVVYAPAMIMPVYEYQQPPPCWTPASSVGPVWTSAAPVEQPLSMMNVCSNQGQPAQPQKKQQQSKPVKPTLPMTNGGSSNRPPKNQRQPKLFKPKGAGLNQKLSSESQALASAQCQEGKDENVKERADNLLGFLRSTDGNKACADYAAAKFNEMVFAEAPDCRAAQLALKEASPPEQVKLLAGLKGQILKAMEDKNANYTVTMAVEIMPIHLVGFISEELLGHGKEVARHRFGCRVICRLLEHHSQKDTSVMQLFEEVLADAENLCTHSFGSIVMRHFLEHGLPEHQHRVAQALCHAKAPEKGEFTTNIVVCSQQRRASHVVEAALTFCSLKDQRDLAELLLPMKEQLDQIKCAKTVCTKLDKMEVLIDSSSTATASELDSLASFSCLSSSSDAVPSHAFADC
jgi:hypothetical protein